MPRNEPDKKIRVLYPDEDSPVTRFENGEGIREVRLQEIAEDGTEEEPLAWFDYIISFDVVKARRILNVKGGNASWNEETKDFDPFMSTDCYERIHANLIHTTDYMGSTKTLSLIGSSEPLEDKHMSLLVDLVDNTSHEWFSVTAGRGWEDWEVGDMPPYLQIVICLREDKYRPLADAISKEGATEGHLRLTDVQGFYAQDTAAPITMVEEVKILERSDIEFIEGVEEGQEPPSLERNKGNFDLHINRYEDGKEASILNALDDEDEWEEEPKLSTDEANQQLLVRVIQEQINQRAQITKLLAPLWLAVIALGTLVGLMWK